METVLSIIAALLLLSVFIFVHELGHYSVGRLLGFKILEFSIGMGPKLLKKERKGILYCLRAFPIGGMCRFYGEDEQVTDSLSFSAQKVWKRILVVVAGPLMNILLAFVFAVLALGIFGDIVPQVVDFTGENSPARVAGMETGDILRAIDGRRISYYAEAATLIQNVKKDTMTVTVERNHEYFDLQVHDFYDAELQKNTIGIYYTGVKKQFRFGEVLDSSASFVGSTIKEMLSFFGQIFTGGVHRGDVAGPVGTISYIGMAVRAGWEVVLRLAVLLSINLGIINLLPLPALDGGRLVFLIVEWIRGKGAKREIEGMVHFAGMVLLMGLVVVLTYSDITMLITGR